MFAWDDVAVFLALHRERTTGRAAAALGCSQPTVVRRIASLEHALSLQLFHRTPTGLVPTQAAQALVSAAEQLERAACAFSAEASDLNGAEKLEIRLTFLDHFERLLIPVLRDFRTRWPRVRTQLLASDLLYDLERGEADIAVRGRGHPKSDELVVHQLPPTGWTAFASADLPPEDRPRRLEEVKQFPIALLESAASTLPVFRWLEEQAKGGAVPIRCSTYSALKSAVVSGAGVSMLPCTIGYAEPDLVACFPPPRQFDVDIFLIARRIALRRPPVRNLFDSIAGHFQEHPELLTGRTS